MSLVILLMLLWDPSFQRRLLEACPPISAVEFNQLRQAAEQIQRNLQCVRKERPKYLPHDSVVAYFHVKFK